MGLVSRVSAAVAVMVVAVLLLAPSLAAAQGSPTGTLTGTITDPSGGVLPGVTVIAKGAQTGLTQQTISGGAGDWRIPASPSGGHTQSCASTGRQLASRATSRISRMS